jgi:hypothetical protein
MPNRAVGITSTLNTPTHKFPASILTHELGHDLGFLHVYNDAAMGDKLGNVEDCLTDNPNNGSAVMGYTNWDGVISWSQCSVNKFKSIFDGTDHFRSAAQGGKYSCATFSSDALPETYNPGGTPFASGQNGYLHRMSSSTTPATTASTFVVSKITVLDVNGAAISSDKLNFDFTSARVQNFSNYTSFKTQLESLLLSNESERKQLTWDLETSQATTLITLKSDTEIGAIEFETDTDDETRDIQFKKKIWNGSTITTPTTSSGYMNRYKGLYEKKSASSSWYKRRFYDFQTPSSRIFLREAKDGLKNITDDRAKAKRLAEVVAERLGGERPDIEAASEADVARVGAKVVPVGKLRVGVCRHRALLYKYCADRVGLSCRLVRGDYREGNHGGAHAWNVVVLYGVAWLCDVMHEPGELYEEGSAKAAHYKRLPERGGGDDGGGAGMASPPASRRRRRALVRL